MAEYIERNAAIKTINKYRIGLRAQGLVILDGAVAEVRKRIDSLPNADVRPVVRGKWLSKEYMYGNPDVGISDMWVERLAEQSDYYAYCSICGKDAGFNGEGSLILSEFCPNCGANMRGDKDE